MKEYILDTMTENEAFGFAIINGKNIPLPSQYLKCTNGGWRNSSTGHVIHPDQIVTIYNDAVEKLGRAAHDQAARLLRSV